MNEEEQIKRDIRYWLDCIEQGMRDWAMDDYCYLCCNCGFITPFAKWTLLKYDENENLVPVEDGDMDPHCVCPVCSHMHIDDDSNPGMRDGTRTECEEARKEEAKIFQDHWSDVELEIIGEFDS